MQLLKITLSLALLAGPACANPTSTIIGGSADVAGSANVVTNIGLGAGTVTQSYIGSITDGSTVMGSAIVRGSAVAQTSIALSSGAAARTEIGTVDQANIMGSVQALGAAGAATAVTFMPGSSTCISVGSVGPGSYGSVGVAAGAGAVLAVDLGFFVDSHVNIGSAGRPC